MGAELVVGTVCEFGHTIASDSSSHCCTSGDVISYSVKKGDTLVTLDYSLVLEIEMTISFSSQSFRLWFTLLLSIKVKGFLTTKAHIYRDVLVLHVIIRWQRDILSITWASHLNHFVINTSTQVLICTYPHNYGSYSNGDRCNHKSCRHSLHTASNLWLLVVVATSIFVGYPLFNT